MEIYISEKEKKEIKQWNDWYKMWHKKFQEEIKELKIELETYRPTKLKGDGQCKCSKCGVICWTNWVSKYKGAILCDSCLKEILQAEKELEND